MKKLEFRYYMKLEFSEEVSEHRFTLRCIPRTTDRQKIERLETDIFPNQFICEQTDSFGNAMIYGYTKEKHERFYFDVRGEAAVGVELFEKEINPQKTGLFKYQTDLTRPGDGLMNYYTSLELKRYEKEKSVKKRAEYIMNCLARDFSYQKGVTGIATTAEDAWNRHQGVCQDYSHIMLSLCRMNGIPCRYVTGMLCGEGMSHAWVEVCENEKWYGIDPTNQMLVEDGHIKISVGRDYNDCIVNQGVFIGTANQKQEILVDVEEMR